MAASKANEALPVLAHRDEIVKALARTGMLIVSAPPGTGKSTQIPQFFLDAGVEGDIVVLQPRRIAARQLAHRVAAERGEAAGGSVGYRVRFESKVSNKTRIFFETYGTFFQRLNNDPRAGSVGLVILDEFHERTLEADCILAWIAALRGAGLPAPRLIVMSATLEGETLSRFLGQAPVISIKARVFPVDVAHQRPQPLEAPARQALRALETLHAQRHSGSILVFMPGAREIRHSLEVLDDFCRRRGYRLLSLQGSQSPAEQRVALEAPAAEPCVIVSTNVAETSLTIPGVTAVIDSGLARVAGYDPQRDRNTLFLESIARSNADQRAGRAGRLSPGRCIRLWDAAAALASAPAPEIERLELSSIALSIISWREALELPAAGEAQLSFLTPPPAARWVRAVASLVELGALSSGASPRLTERGRSLVGWPVRPLVARLLLEAKAQGFAETSAAMAALWESESDERAMESDLYSAAVDFLDNPGSKGRMEDAGKVFHRLRDLCRLTESDLSRERALRSKAGFQKKVTLTWLSFLKSRFASLSDSEKSYRLADGRIALIDTRSSISRAPLPTGLLALSLQDTGGSGTGRRCRLLRYLPCDTAWIVEAFPAECPSTDLCRWDEKRRRAVAEKQVAWNSHTLERRPLQKGEKSEAATALLVEKLLDGTVDPLKDNEEAQQLIFRARLAARTFPDSGFPIFSREDWELLYHDLCEGKNGADDIASGDFLQALRAYAGEGLAASLDRLAPVRVKLPSGRLGKVIYSETTPPELSARLGDLWGMKGRFTVCDGKVEGVFDILAPNYRTVQKTADLSRFWTTIYPEIKQQLKRRYPRHVWP